MRFREIRKACGLSVNAVAARLGVDPSTYRKWELGSNAINLDMAIRCADIYGCSLDDLAGRQPHDGGELALVNSYRSCSDEGRRAIMASAEAMAAAFPRGEAQARVGRSA